MGAYLPLTVTAGVTFRGTVALDDYSAAGGWSVVYALRSTGTNYAFNTVPFTDGTSHLYTVPYTQTGTWVAGPYVYSAFAEGLGERHLVANGNITVLPDPTTTATPASHARVMMRAIEAALEGNVSSQLVISNTLPDGSQIQYSSPESLLKWYEYYRGLVAAEDEAQAVAEGRATGRVIDTQFGEVY